jgi:hypothetical protein
MLSQVALPDGVEALFEDDYPVANVALPKLIELPEDEEEGEEGEEGEEAEGEKPKPKPRNKFDLKPLVSFEHGAADGAGIDLGPG